MFDFLISDVRAKLKHELFETALVYRKNPDCQYSLALEKTQKNKDGEGVTETIGMAASQRLWDTCVSVLVTNVTVLALCAVP